MLSNFCKCGFCSAACSKSTSRDPLPLPFGRSFSMLLSTFLSQKDPRLHAESQHLNIRFPCPLADQFHCSQTFTRKRDARVPAQSNHEGVGYPCPLAEQFHCSLTFRRESDARNHIDAHQGISYPCPAAEKYNCSTIFRLECNARRHVHRHIKPSLVASFQGAWRAMKHVPAFLLM